MNKELKIFDKGDVKDKCIKGTKIILAETGTGKVLFEGSNKVIISGSEYNAIKDFDFSGSFATSDSQKFLGTIKSYDEALAANDHPLVPTANTSKAAAAAMFPYTPEGSILKDSELFNAELSEGDAKKEIYDYFTRRVCLFCVGNDGCGEEASRVFKVHNTKWIAPWGYADYDPGTGSVDETITNCLIPFKYRSTDSDLSDSYRNIYFGRSIDSGDTAIAYYFKAFSSAPEFIRRYADDSAFLSSVDNVWADPRGSEAEAVVKLKMEISNSDCREWFNKSSGVSDAKINTISLCTAVPYLSASGGQLYYADIRPFTRFNFPNESLVGYTKGIDITYYLYY